MERLFSIPLTRIDGSPFSLADFRGQVMLLVNTASRCGFTPQYAGLQTLFDRYRDRGFTVIGFPCNQFGAQEPGSDAEIAAFCCTSYAVSFPLSGRIEVNGAQTHPLFAELKVRAPGLLGSRAIKWNFTKFLIDRTGRVVSRYAPRTDPERIAGAIEKLLLGPAQPPAAGSLSDSQ